MGIGQVHAATIPLVPPTPASTSTTVPDAGPPPLPDPLDALALSGDPGAELAALAVESGQAQRRSARAARDACEAAEVHEQDAEIAAMRQKADDLRVEGLIEGAGMAAQGVGAVGGDATKGVGLMAGGAAKVVATGRGADAANDDADATLHKNAAAHAKDAADAMHDTWKEGADYVKAALDFYREYTSTQAQSRSAALHRA
ncbi:MAG TPA: hypothetical protein VIF15_16410 [Polyangiaceae bacterium]|jgi:hypothetical protein